MKIGDIVTGEEFKTLVRETGLRYDPELRPYHSSEIVLASLEIDTLFPLAKYVLEDNLEHLDRIRTALMAQGLDMFQLSGRVEIFSGSERNYIAPPVIEAWPNEGRLIVDGLHRVWLARKYGVNQVTCIFIHHASFPLVPLPVRWEDVIKYQPGNYPAEKHLFRFDKLSDVALLEGSEQWGVTEANFRYFFYRDLSHLGSPGIRQFPKSEDKEST